MISGGRQNTAKHSATPASCHYLAQFIQLHSAVTSTRTLLQILITFILKGNEGRSIVTHQHNHIMDINSTADDVAKYFTAQNMVIKGRTFMVTGANCGLGLETARCIAANGGIVIILSRSLNNGNEAVANIKKNHKDAKVSTMVVDLSSFKSIRECAEAYMADGKPLDALINNAGIMACPKSLTEDGFESQIGEVKIETKRWNPNCLEL